MSDVRRVSSFRSVSPPKLQAIKVTCTVYVGNLSFFTREEQIYELFSKCGDVKRVVMGLNRHQKAPCGFCFVEYFKHEQAELAVNLLNKTSFDDRIIRVDLDAGYSKGREYGRGETGGQWRDDFREDVDAARGGKGGGLLKRIEGMPGRQVYRGNKRKDHGRFGAAENEAGKKAKGDKAAGGELRSRVSVVGVGRNTSNTCIPGSVAALDACSNWTGADLKRILQPFLQKGVAIAGIINEGTAIEDTQTLEEAGVKSGQLYLMLRSCTYLIEDAGAEVVNGYYVQKEGELNKSPVYANEAGILLFKYKMARGSEYWYLSRDGDLSRSDGDYYRVRSNSKRPPEEGWSWEACPLGRRTTIPTLTYFGSDKELGGFCSSSTASGEAQQLGPARTTVLRASNAVRARTLWRQRQRKGEAVSERPLRQFGAMRGRLRHRFLALALGIALHSCPVGFLGYKGETPFKQCSQSRCVALRASFDQQRAAKRELLDAVKDFKRELSKSGGDLSVDFGVKGGELDKKDRAPKNLAAAGVFRAVSEDLGDAADRVLELADLLARYTPNKEPLKHFGTSLGSDCPLHGAWSLLFTTAADATFTKNSTRGAAKVCNVVDAKAGTVTNCIDFEEASALESLRVRLTARPASPTRLDLAFRYIRARVKSFFGIPLGGRRLTLTLPVAGPFLTRVLSFFTRKPPPQPYFDLLYLDDTLRVHRTGQGNLFIQEITKPPPFV
ncbi:Cbp20 [Symbiodinium sp. CCMP2456]|nr:Cbp20 [Symbiodinium sp. CCMP2456]